MFAVSHSTTTNVSKEGVWSSWEDVSSWPTWDQSLKAAEAKEGFIVGKKAVLMSLSGPPVEATFVSIDKEKGEFTNQANLGVLVVKTFHSVSEEEGMTRITHKATIEVKDPQKGGPLASKIWTALSEELPASVDKLARVARGSVGTKRGAPAESKDSELKPSKKGKNS
ncbi:SRPBCC family protein [Candidatus Neptunichlamydia sp. REUL1]|uniref:SRPBCC family protein n=1 Tax=Candidatus Neptunichlamydia sp. REUL1 TaxID=3064277 RepID=UPI00292E80DB|nr:SRPBCC family protein [Candidatus Neptunochlamydia sp. REUL1]